MMTALDLQEIAIRFLGVNVTDPAIRDCRLAIRMAIAELAKEYNWPRYISQERLAIQEQYHAGTVAYTAATRQFTLSGGTWPTWANYATIRVGSTWAKVITRNSATVITIEERTDFRTDLAAGQSYFLNQDEYPLDGNFLKVSRAFVDTGRYSGMEYRDPMNFAKMKRPQAYATQYPRYYTVVRDRNVPGGLAMAFWPLPQNSRSVSFSAIRFPDMPTVWDEHAGKVTVTASSAAVAGAGTAFESAHEGCVLRVARTPAPPTSLDGDNPYAEEVVVDSVTNATSLTAKTPFTTSRATKGFCLSSLVDIEEDTMRAVLVQRVYKELARVRVIKDQDVQVIEATYQQLLKAAKSSANPDASVSHAGDFYQESPFAGLYYLITP